MPLPLLLLLLLLLHPSSSALRGEEGGEMEVDMEAVEEEEEGEDMHL